MLCTRVVSRAWRESRFVSTTRLYVQRDFLAKLFALCALQLAVCFGGALVACLVVKDQAPHATPSFCTGSELEVFVSLLWSLERRQKCC